MSNRPSTSRPPAPVVPPVVHQGVRYEQDRVDERQGDTPGGYLVALDDKTGARLWRLQVYELKRPPGAPTGGFVYFASMRLSEDGAALEIKDETGVLYRVDLASRTATRVGGTPIEAPQAEPDSPKPAPPKPAVPK
jgi:outer membrane protein assembly factor BamB